MRWWLVYERCDDCTEHDCLQCRREKRSLTLRMVQAEERPANSLNGPCLTPQEMMDRIGEFFVLDEATGKINFRSTSS